MGDQEMHLSLLGQPKQIIFDHMVSTMIGPAAITEQEHGIGVGIAPLQVLLPIPQEIVTDKFRGILTHA